MAGYCGKLLRVNLTTGEIKKEPLDLNVAKKFLGGRGLESYFLSQEIDPGIDPLIFATNMA
ncbi:aldehyde ferredoxin oxidoreductase N-terminal domain-containing protein [Carboxydothermus pertinax]|nr:aldehyde ferredoxin oxidoreductase N-terminal domain-containing protein [Carboxydothermus pertinax]